MRYELLTNPYSIRDDDVVYKILTNRGIDPAELPRYINSTDEMISSPLLFGEERLRAGVAAIANAVKNNLRTIVIVDSDVDGFTSSAILLNYLYDLFPTFVLNHVDWVVHEGKQHGLADQMERIKNAKYKLVICPDSASNDYEQHKELVENNDCTILILDHHEAPIYSDHAITINNQMCNYPNKELSGAGVTWQFCKYFDSLMKTNYADSYLDLVALGLDADMMSLRITETKHLIQKGFEPQNVINPFIYSMWEKNSFKLGEKITPIGAAFYIAPLVNAICRSGEMKDKKIVFSSMLKYMAFEKIPSTKRGHKQGELERIVDQALRTCTNVKNKQTKAQEEGIQKLESMIFERNLLRHKVLLFLLDSTDIPAEIRGLIANKFMAKYQRPCCILTRNELVPLPWNTIEEEQVLYQGSARGYDKSGITNFKDICEETNCVNYAQGHQGAFGISIPEEKLEEFIFKTDEALKDMTEEPIYFVDYVFDAAAANMGKIVLDIAEMDQYWGKDIDEPMIYIKDIPVGENNIKVMKSNTLKIVLPNKIDIIKFKATDEEIEKLSQNTKINAICYCRKNEWNYQINPQLELVDYQIQPKRVLWDF